jgi:hypothetical protein
MRINDCESFKRSFATKGEWFPPLVDLKGLIRSIYLLENCFQQVLHPSGGNESLLERCSTRTSPQQFKHVWIQHRLLAHHKLVATHTCRFLVWNWLLCFFIAKRRPLRKFHNITTWTTLCLPNSLSRLIWNHQFPLLYFVNQSSQLLAAHLSNLLLFLAQISLPGSCL